MASISPRRAPEAMAVGRKAADDIEGKSDIWSNDGGIFTALGLNLPAPISSIGRGGTFTWFDLDGDGDLDYLVAGAYYVPGGNGLVEARMHLYRNEAGPDNLSPSAPADLTAVSVGGGVALACLQAAVQVWQPTQRRKSAIMVQRVMLEPCRPW